MDIKKIGVIGCGKMAGAILEGVVKNKFISGDRIFVYDVNNDSSKILKEKFNFQVVSSIKEIFEVSDFVLIATKPFVINDVLNEIKVCYNGQLVASIAAGVKIDKYLSFVNNMKIVRIMPNTPALVNLGMSAVCKSDNVNNDEFEYVYSFMQNCGQVIKTTEDKMDVITALSGSGPAYYYKIIELMAMSAHKLGLDYKQALLLSAQTALGSAKMVIENDFNINQLIKNVTTPGGCTEVGNNVLNNSNINEIIYKTIYDTMNKAIELG